MKILREGAQKYLNLLSNNAKLIPSIFNADKERLVLVQKEIQFSKIK